MECKGKKSQNDISVEDVLIETLWNVKVSPSILPTAPLSFNRNIVECKESSAISTAASDATF